MAKKLLAMLFMVVLALPLSSVVFAQDAPMKMAKEAKWEGKVIRINADKSTLTVRKGDGVEMAVTYDSSTHWVSQYHGAKTVNEIDASQVKEGDYVIAKGTWESKGVLHATLVSKRLSHPA
jgi:hypothetical protein